MLPQEGDVLGDYTVESVAYNGNSNRVNKDPDKLWENWSCTVVRTSKEGIYLADSLTHSLTHSLADSLTHSLPTHSHRCRGRRDVYDLVMKHLAEHTDQEHASKPLTERSEILLGLRPWPKKAVETG